MKRVDLKVGFSCNNHCRFCAQGDKRKTHKDKSTSEIKKILKECRNDYDQVVFTGGEVSIRSDFPELVEYANKLDFEVIQIQTNGRRFAYMNYCKKLIEKGADEFAIALHGSTAEIHDGLTRAQGSFKQTTQGMRNLVSLNQRVLTNTVITKQNYKDLPNLADLFIDIGVDQFQFAFIHINQIIKNDPDLIEEIVPRKSNVMTYVKKGLDKGIKAGMRVMTEAIPFCFMESYEDYIAENNYIPEGTVYDGDLHIEDYGEYRKNEGKKKAEKCKECKYYKICEGPWKEYPDIFGWEEFNPVKD